MGPGICRTPNCGKPRHYRETKLRSYGFADSYRADCYECHLLKEAKRKNKTKKEVADSRNYRKYKKDYCENVDGLALDKELRPIGCPCKGFHHAGQLDVDHIDKNRDNNDPKNLQTLCCNCHRHKSDIDRQIDIFKYQSEKNKMLIMEKHPTLEQFLTSGQQPVTRGDTIRARPRQSYPPAPATQPEGFVNSIKSTT